MAWGRGGGVQSLRGPEIDVFMVWEWGADVSLLSLSGSLSKGCVFVDYLPLFFQPEVMWGGCWE